LKRVWIFHNPDSALHYRYSTKSTELGKKSVEKRGEPGYFDLYNS